MKADTKIQLAMAALGLPAIFYFWRADAKWPNPFALQPAVKSSGPNSSSTGRS